MALVIRITNELIAESITDTETYASAVCKATCQALHKHIPGLSFHVEVIDGADLYVQVLGITSANDNIRYECMFTDRLPSKLRKEMRKWKKRGFGNAMNIKIKGLDSFCRKIKRLNSDKGVWGDLVRTPEKVSGDLTLDLATSRKESANERLVRMELGLPLNP